MEDNNWHRHNCATGGFDPRPNSELRRMTYGLNTGFHPPGFQIILVQQRLLCSMNKFKNHASTAAASEKAIEPKHHQAPAPVNIVAFDDDPLALLALNKHLNRMGHHVSTASNGTDGLDLVNENTQVVILALRMPDLNGLDCLQYLRQNHPQVKSIILTACSEVERAVEAMQYGAFQYITKPFIPDELQVLIQKAHESILVQQENTSLRESLSNSYPAQLYSDDAECNEELSFTINRIANLDSTAFISGESGTGKSTIARMIHQNSSRSQGPFVAINCASLPRELIESELFGHSRGAFTGAVSDRLGRAEVADGGTLFLDEIGDLPLELQPKILTFLQERSIQPLGSNEVRQVDVRLIVATHRDLRGMCQDNLFREDLFYRLNVLRLHLPGLRERQQEIPTIADSILTRICGRQQLEKPSFHPEALHQLVSYAWPGNIRELENVLERAVAFCDSQEIRVENLTFDGALVSQSDSPTSSLPSQELTLEELEREAIIQRLEFCKGNKAKTARSLGISEKSIYNKMRRLDIVPKKSNGAKNNE